MKKDLTIDEIYQILDVPKPKAYNHVTFDIKNTQKKLERLKKERDKLLDKWDKELDKAADKLDEIDPNWRNKVRRDLLMNKINK